MPAIQIVISGINLTIVVIDANFCNSLETNKLQTIKNETNKIEIKQAVEAMFGVKVESVNVMNVKPKKKRMGRYEGKTNRRRKAIVKLAEGESINYFGEE